jgi:hypothetical protein
MSYTGPEITLTMIKLQETVRLRLFETRLWAKEIVLTQTGRQLLVTDQTANILSNFLAVFLALAARSLYNVVRRILRVFNSGHEDKTQILGAGVAGRAGSDDSVTEPTGAQPQSPPIETPRNIATTTLEEFDVTDSTEAISEARGTDAMNVSEAQERHERQLERLEVIDESHDTETLILKTFRKFISQLRSIVPVRPLGDNTPTYRRMLKTKFWSNMFKIANESSRNLLWHLLVGLGALVLYFGALLLGIMSAYPVVGDSVAVPTIHNAVLSYPQPHRWTTLYILRWLRSTTMILRVRVGSTLNHAMTSEIAQATLLVPTLVPSSTSPASSTRS